MANEDNTFDLLVERRDGSYRARVLNSPAGNVTADLTEPIPDEQFKDFLSRFGQIRHISRGASLSVSDETKKFGSQIFDFLFPDPISDCLRESRLLSEG